MATAARNGSAREGLVLAVDGGNAKTDLALVDSTGTLVSVVRGGGSSPHHLGIEGCVQVLQGLLEPARARAELADDRGPLASIAYLLLAGADTDEERATLRARFEQLNWSERLVVENDTLALLRAGTDRGWGVAVVCGAGINCIGIAPDGREVRFDALGPISGDWGGGEAVGLAAVAAAARSADGRGPLTILERAVPAHYGLSDIFTLSRAFHRRQISQARLGELARLVYALCEEDSVAASIVRRLAEEVVAFARAAVRRLELGDAGPDVVLGGGLMRAAPPAMVDTIAQGVTSVAPNARVSVSPSDPIVGAVLLGLDALAAGPVATVRARAELDAAVDELRRTSAAEADSRTSR